MKLRAIFTLLFAFQALTASAATNAVDAAGVTYDPLTASLFVLPTSSEKTTVPLANKGFAGPLRLHAEGALKRVPVQLDGAEAICVSFGLDDGQGQARFIAALLVKFPGSEWKVAHEWLAECGPLGELSFKREKQDFTSPQPGTLLRKARKYKSEGHTFKLDCGCNVCQSATFDYNENETWVWNAQKKQFERTLMERAYIVQYGEGLMGVARKALGDARLMARLYRMNPDIKPGGVLKEGQAVVFERIVGQGTGPSEPAK
jgi:hypothetical protein